MTPKTQQLIDRVRELDGKATPGPWIMSEDGYSPMSAVTRTLVPYSMDDVYLKNEYRTAAPLLARALEIAVTALEIDCDGGKAVREALKEIESLIGGK